MFERLVEGNRRWLSPLAGLLVGALYLSLLAGGGRLLLIGLTGLLAVNLLLLLRADRWPAWLWQHQEWATLALIVGLGLAVRLLGVGFGLPYTDQPDEPSVADKSLKMLQTGDLNPHYYTYPHLYYYMQAALYSLRYLALVSNGTATDITKVNATDFYLWGRLLTVVLGCCTIVATYRAAKRLYGAVAGLAAAAFIASSSIHIVNSQFITTDVPASFFTALAFALICGLFPAIMGESLPAQPSSASEALTGGELRSAGYYLLLGVSMGLALGSKYNSVLIVLPFLLAHAYAGGWQWRRVLGGRLWLGLLAMIASFLLTTPTLLGNVPQFLNEVGSVVTHYKFTGHPGFEGDENWKYYLTALLTSDTLVTLLGLVGVGIALLRHRRADLLLLSFPLIYYLTLSGYKVNFLRNLLPMLPFVAILASLPLAYAYAHLRAHDWRLLGKHISQRATVGGLVLMTLLMVVAPTMTAVQNGWKNTQIDNRTLARTWLDQQGRGAKLWLEPFSLLLPSDRYLVQGGDSVLSHPLAWYASNRFDYLILADKGAQADFASNHAALRAADFPRSKEHPGPAISIYRTGYQPPTASSLNARRPLTVTLSEAGGGSVTLLGADLPDRQPPGSQLPLTLYWRCDLPLKADYTVFVHLLDRNGKIVAQRDTQPRSGSLPTSSWQSEQLVVDEQDLDLPADLPADGYRLVIGFYVQSSGARLQGGRGGEVELGAVRLAK